MHKPDQPDATPDLTATWSLPEDLGRRFAKVAGDRNPIHMYWWTARLFGFRRPIIHGMWTLARCMAALGNWWKRRKESANWKESRTKGCGISSTG